METDIQLKRGCPLTGGGPISMTQGAFERCCAARKKEAEERQDIESDMVCFAYPCLTCQGPPDLLTIINADNMPTRKAKRDPKRRAPASPPIVFNWKSRNTEPTLVVPKKAVPKNGIKVPKASNKIKEVKEKKMDERNNNLIELNKKLFAQLDRLADDKLQGAALSSEINRAQAVTNIACQIISVGNLALKARVALKAGDKGGNLPKMLEG